MARERELTEYDISELFAVLRNPNADDSHKDNIRYRLLDAELLEECGCCGGLHPVRRRDMAKDDRFNGGMYECRSNANRF